MTMKSDRPRVLLVDDYPDAREMYTEYLEFSGFEVVEAGNGKEALQRAVDTAPDIIFAIVNAPKARTPLSSAPLSASFSRFRRVTFRVSRPSTDLAAATICER